MAVDYDDDEFPDDDEFDDYNPHPYSGGYDVFATYGAPRPPSAATCYPVSTRAAVTAPTAPQPSAPSPSPPRSTPAPASPPRSAPAPAPASPPPPPAEPYYWPKPYDWGDAPRDRPTYATPEVFRRWPFLSASRCHCGCARDYWRQCMRGLDYLFGHSDGYGERHIGVDCTGVPVYANRKGGVEDAVGIEVPPTPATETVQWHYADDETQHQSNQLSWYSSAQEDEPAEPTAYASYDQSYYQQSYSYQDEPSWFSNHSYQEYYKDQDDSQYQQDYSSYDAYKISSQPTVCYNQHFGEQPLHFHVEPPETVSYHKLEYYENFSTYANENEFYTSNSYEIQPYLHTPSDHLEPYRPSWSQDLGYYQACTEGVPNDYYDNHAMASNESWDMSSLFMSPFYPQETQIYEHSYGDENV